MSKKNTTQRSDRNKKLGVKTGRKNKTIQDPTRSVIQLDEKSGEWVGKPTGTASKLMLDFQEDEYGKPIIEKPAVWKELPLRCAYPIPGIENPSEAKHFRNYSQRYWNHLSGNRSRGERFLSDYQIQENKQYEENRITLAELL